jgi:hypothetical protein
MITLVSPVTAVNSVVTGTDDVIFRPSLLSLWAAGVIVVRRYYDAGHYNDGSN